MTYSKEQLDLIDNTILFYTTRKRKSGRDRIDEDIRNELKGLEDYYYKLTRKQDIVTVWVSRLVSTDSSDHDH